MTQRFTLALLLAVAAQADKPQDCFKSLDSLVDNAEQGKSDLPIDSDIRLLDTKLSPDHQIIEVGGCYNGKGVQSMYTVWATFDESNQVNDASKYTTETHAYGKASNEPPGFTCKGLQLAKEEHISFIGIFGAENESRIEKVVMYSSSTLLQTLEIGETAQESSASNGNVFYAASADPFNSFFGFVSQNVITEGPPEIQDIATLGVLTEDPACIDIYFYEKAAVEKALRNFGNNTGYVVVSDDEEEKESVFTPALVTILVMLAILMLVAIVLLVYRKKRDDRVVRMGKDDEDVDSSAKSAINNNTKAKPDDVEQPTNRPTYAQEHLEKFQTIQMAKDIESLASIQEEKEEKLEVGGMDSEQIEDLTNPPQEPASADDFTIPMEQQASASRENQDEKDGSSKLSNYA